jgi:hypothetical protein
MGKKKAAPKRSLVDPPARAGVFRVDGVSGDRATRPGDPNRRDRRSSGSS